MSKATAFGGVDHIVIRLRRKERPKENQIIELKNKKITVGFIIPGAALLSTSHKYVRNAMFGPFAIIAIDHIIKMAGQEISEKIKEFPKYFDGMKRPLTLDQFIDQNCFYCVFNAECEAKTAEEFVDFYFPQLIENGFFADSQAFALGNRSTRQVSISDSLNLKKASTDFPFLRKALFELIPHEKNSFFAFFYAWQVVEFFMQIEFERKIQIFVEKYKNRTNIVRARKSLDVVNEFAKEKNRVRSVFSKNDEILVAAINRLHKKIESNLDFIDSQEKISEVDNEMNETIKNNEEAVDSMPDDTDFASKLYYIRNIMFHSFSSIDKFNDSMSEMMECLLLYLANKCSHQG
ncbi:hypothetical protein [Massilia glaciei]|uniref:hypothetical protein n=1 Tax=Massilia glaciei TaxID=1524097 RepID=UPI0011B24DFB|nr:hypothetical protein [Massilia glaciei]